MKRNIITLLFIVLFLFAVISVKFAHIQIVQADKLQREVVEQRVKTIKETPERGKITDRKGNLLAISLTMKDIAVYPNLIKTEETQKKIAKTLSDILDEDYDKILAMVQKKDKNGNPVQWARVKKKVHPEVANQLMQSDISSFIEITNAPERHYVNDSLASNIMGFVNEEGEPGAGLELALNNYLGGIPGYKISEFDHMGEIIPIGNETVSKATPGNDIQLTIDSYIQNILEETIAKFAKEMEPDQIHTVVMDPNNGEILGMASYPTFNPNEYLEYDEETYNIHPASYVYEPGSTFKPIYISMALEAGTIDENSRFNDAGSVSINGVTVSNWNHQGLGNIGLEDIVVHSSNVGMVGVSRTLNEKQVYEGLNKLGFGEKTGIELPNEEFGLFPSEEQLKSDPVMKATQSYGHGIGVTPLQIATAFSTIVNGGEKVTPTLLKTVTDKNGTVLYNNENKKRERVLSKKNAELVKGYLNASWNSGTKQNSVEGYEGGLKTGTTKKLVDGIYTDKIVGSLIGFAPYENPRYVMLAVVDNPKDPQYNFGANTGGPIFKEAMTKILEYENVPKDQTEGEGSTEELEEEKKEIVFDIKDYRLEFFDNAKEELEKEFKDKIKIIKSGDGEIIVNQNFKYKRNKLEVHFETSNIKGKGKTYIPDLIGLEKKDIVKLFKGQGIEVEFYGDGKVFDQDIKRGSYDKKIEKITLWFEE